MDIRLVLFKEDAERLKEAFGPSMRVKKMRDTDRKSFVYVNNAGPSCFLRIAEILAGVSEVGK